MFPRGSLCWLWKNACFQQVLLTHRLHHTFPGELLNVSNLRIIGWDIDLWYLVLGAKIKHDGPYQRDLSRELFMRPKILKMFNTHAGWWFEHFSLFFHSVKKISSSQLTNSYFSEELKPPTSMSLLFLFGMDPSSCGLLHPGTMVHCETNRPVSS